MTAVFCFSQVVPFSETGAQAWQVLQMLEARSVPAPVVHLLASARFDPEPVHEQAEQAADRESLPVVPAGEDSRLDS